MKIIVQNLAVEYEDIGSGEVILLLHGWKDNLHTFDLIVHELTKTYRVIRLDLPGFGGSELPTEDWNLDNYIEFVSSFVKKLNVNVSTYIGHSFGGRIIIKGTANGNLNSNKIILIGSAGLADRQTFRNSILKFLAKIGKFLTSIPPLSFWKLSIRKSMYNSIGSDYFGAGKLKNTFVKVISEDLTEYAKKINIPTELIWGINDTSTPLIEGQKLSKLIINSQLNIIKDSGHFVHKEKPNEVIELIKKFI